MSTQQDEQASDPSPFGANVRAPARGKGRRLRALPDPTSTLATVKLLSRTLDDLEHARKMTANRIGAAARSGTAPLGLDLALELLASAEAEVVKQLEANVKLHPLAAWGESIPGVGRKTLGRLLAETGNPVVREVGRWEGEDAERRWIVTGTEPRSIAQLRAYAGHGDSRRRKVAGMSQAEALKLGNPRAKMRVYLIAVAATKQRCAQCLAASKARKVPTTESEAISNLRPSSDSPEAVGYTPPPSGCTCAETHPLRAAYDEARARYAERVHEKAERGRRAGEPWTPGHQHAAALRFVGKKFLKLLHNEASRLNGLGA